MKANTQNPPVKMYDIAKKIFFEFHDAEETLDLKSYEISINEIKIIFDACISINRTAWRDCYYETQIDYELMGIEISSLTICYNESRLDLTTNELEKLQIEIDKLCGCLVH